MKFRALRISAWYIAAVLLAHLARSEEAPPANDPDAGRVPPENIVITLKGKASARLGSGYLWRMANRIHLAWAAQKPVPIEEDQWFWFDFFLYPDGSVSDLKLTDTKLDANGKKAVRAFLDATPFEALTEVTQKNLEDPIALRISIWLKAEKPNQ